LEISDASEIITVDEPAVEITRSKKNSSMARGLTALSEGAGDVFISAGNSGALLVGASLIVRRAKGVKRIAFAPVIPNRNGSFLLIDGGANVSCTPEMLSQFGIMGSDYIKKILKVNEPRVGLLNIGTEKSKGDDLRKSAFKLLSESGINFVGNVEAREVPKDAAEVIVTDGFTGNVFLKLYEGMTETLMYKFKEVLNKNSKTKLGALLIKKELEEMKKNIDYTECSGAPLLGAAKPIFKMHGNADAKAVKSVIYLAVKNFL
jgi:glycerol-3-phosphate acyltransferase PlsX